MPISFWVIANSPQFAAEAIGAFRTVTSLTLEDMISTRYDVLLKDHVKNAFDKAKYSTLVFALSDSVPLACMVSYPNFSEYCILTWQSGELLLSNLNRSNSLNNKAFALKTLSQLPIHLC